MIYTVSKKIIIILTLLFMTMIITACSKKNTNTTYSQEQKCIDLKVLIQKDFNLYNNPNYIEKCGNECDWMAVKSKLVDIVYSDKDKKCYLAQERIGVEWINYYEIFNISKSISGYQYIGDAVWSDTCVSEDLYLSAIDPEILTGIKLEKNKKNTVCDYKADRLDKLLKDKIKELKWF